MKNPLPILLMSLVCLAAVPATIVNGGLIVFHGLQAHWTGAPHHASTFVIVTDDAEFARLARRLKVDNYTDTERLAEGGPDMTLTALDSQRLSGRLVVSGRRVLVVSRSYAMAHPTLERLSALFQH